MAATTAQIQHRRDTADNWTSANPTLAAGQFGIETDTNKLKIGDGATAWTSLAYFTGGGAGSGDVTGPSSAVDSNLAAFDTTSGKLLKDAGVAVADLATDAEVTSAISTHAGATDPHGDRAYADGLASNYATAAQGALADTATQPGDLGTAAATDATDYATAAQGTLADTAVQPDAIATKLDDLSAGTADAIVTASADGTLLTRAAYTIATLLAAARDRATHTGTQLASTISDFATAVQALFGTSSGTICEGNDSRLSDARTPTGSASGDLSGSYPSPTVTQARGLRETSGPTTLTVGAVADGEYLKRSGSTLVGDTPAGGGGGTSDRWIGAGELIPRVTNGAGIDGEELTTNKINLDYLAFDAGTQEYAQVTFAWPSGFTTYTVKFYWTAASGSGAVVFSSSARCYADDAALDQEMGTAQTVTDTLLLANDTHISSATSAITPAGTVAAGNLTVVQISRVAGDGSDTLAVDARLIGVYLAFSA